EGLTKRSAVGFLLRSLIMFQTFISRHNSNFFSDKLVLTSVTPASSAPVLQTPKATSSTLYFDSLTVNARSEERRVGKACEFWMSPSHTIYKCFHVDDLKRDEYTVFQYG